MHHACVGLGSNQENRAVGNRGQARNDIVECGTFLLRDTQNALAKLLNFRVHEGHLS
ncbi:UNVERIFIED_ORG: hypothetical protein ABIB63_004074 [Xanthomonas axonopodis]